MAGVRMLQLVRLDHLAVDLVCPPSIVPDRLDRHIYIDPPRPAECLSVVECFERSQFVGVCLYEICQLLEELPALGPGNFETP